MSEDGESHLVASWLDADISAGQHGRWRVRPEFARETATTHEIGRPGTFWIIEIAQSFVRSGRFCIGPGWVM